MYARFGAFLGNRANITFDGCLVCTFWSSRMDCYCDGGCLLGEGCPPTARQAHCQVAAYRIRVATIWPTSFLFGVVSCSPRLSPQGGQRTPQSDHLGRLQASPCARCAQPS